MIKRNVARRTAEVGFDFVRNNAVVPEPLGPRGRRPSGPRQRSFVLRLRRHRLTTSSFAMPPSSSSTMSARRTQSTSDLLQYMQCDYVTLFFNVPRAWNRLPTCIIQILVLETVRLAAAFSKTRERLKACYWLSLITTSVQLMTAECALVQ